MTFKHEEFTLEKIKQHAENQNKGTWVLGYKEYANAYEVQLFDPKNLFYKATYWKTSLRYLSTETQEKSQRRS